MLCCAGARGDGEPGLLALQPAVQMKSPGLGRTRSGLLRDGMVIGAPAGIPSKGYGIHFERRGDVTWITSLRFLRVTAGRCSKGSTARSQNCWQKRRGLRRLIAGPLLTRSLRRDPRCVGVCGGYGSRHSHQQPTKPPVQHWFGSLGCSSAMLNCGAFSLSSTSVVSSRPPSSYWHGRITPVTEMAVSFCFLYIQTPRKAHHPKSADAVGLLLPFPA